MQKFKLRWGLSSHHQANPRLHPSHRAQVRRHLLQPRVNLQAKQPLPTAQMLALEQQNKSQREGKLD